MNVWAIDVFDKHRWMLRREFTCYVAALTALAKCVRDGYQARIRHVSRAG